MQRLLEMRAELRAEQAAGAFAAALAEFQRDLPPIEKRQIAKIASQKGTFTYRYADLGDIQRAIGAKLAACGLSVTFDTEEHDNTLDVVCRVHHIQGHSQSARFPVPVDRSARMNAAQQVGAALTYGRRYALTAALGIVTADEDTDAQGAPERAPAPGAQRSSRAESPSSAPSGAPQPARHTEAPTPQPISEAQHRRLEARIKELRLDRERVKRWTAAAFGVEHFPDLSPEQYQRLDERLEVFAERAAIEAETQGEPA
ncbi:MAG: hypothetical protein GVY22_18490 [Gammaproteobacteria bacterium]|nr:hypothetical protein [Gammaproteobacteria bacterium]